MTVNSVVLIFGFLVFIAGTTLSRRPKSISVSFANYKIYDVVFPALGNLSSIVRNVDLNHAFEMLHSNRKFGKNGEISIVNTYLVPPGMDEAFKKSLNSSGFLDFAVNVENLETVIQAERNPSGRRKIDGGRNFLEVYHSYDEITAYLDKISKIRHPKTGNPLAIIDDVGKTYEGREMYMAKISSDHKAKKPIVFIEAGIHAREWVAPATAIYILNQLVENYTANSDVLEKIDFYIIPVSNPDGYEYSMKSNRLWRKTRSFYGGSYGTDGNRNFNFHWGGEGSSQFPNSIIFRGPKPFSEPETKNIRDAGEKYASRIKLFISLHCYGPAILFPWGYAANERAPQHEIMYEIGKMAAVAIENVTGTIYEVGVSSEIFYPAAGGSDDYFKGVLGVDLSFTIELSGGGSQSFIIPSSEILKIASEAFVGIKVMAMVAAGYKN